MSEVAVPRALLAVSVLLIAAAALGGLYYFYVKGAGVPPASQIVQSLGGAMGEATGSGSSEGAPIRFRGGSVSVVYETHDLSIYYNVSQDLGSLPGVGNVTPTIYEAQVDYPILVIDPGSTVEPYNETGLILAVADMASGLSGISPLVYGYSDGQRIMIIPRIVLLYELNDDEKLLNITIVVPKINVTCSGGSCDNLQGRYAVRVSAKIVDILPYPYQSYNPIAEGRYVEASLQSGQQTMLPPVCFGKVPIARVGLEYNVGIDIMVLYYDIYLERVG